MKTMNMTVLSDNTPPYLGRNVMQTMNMTVLSDGIWQSVDIFTNQHIVLVGIPGAFTPTCEKQLPTFIKEYNTFKAKGIDEVYCISINDCFVMQAWAKSMNFVNNKIKLISDGNGVFTTSNDLMDDYSDKGLGMRSKRYALVVKNGQIIYTGFNMDAYAEPVLKHMSLKHL